MASPEKTKRTMTETSFYRSAVSIELKNIAVLHYDRNRYSNYRLCLWVVVEGSFYLLARARAPDLLAPNVIYI